MYDETRKIKIDSSSSHSTLLIEGLTKTFLSGQKEIKVLDQINLSVQAGESLAIIGPSGSGKSTLLGLIAGLDDPSSGRVVVEGNDLSMMDEERLTAFRGRRMGYIFQSYRLISTLTAIENVEVPLALCGDRQAMEKAEAWLTKVGLRERATHFPEKLSGGEQQRVALARVLAPQPSLILADEPTGNLDTQTGQEMTAMLFSLVRQIKSTLILVTHEEKLAQQTERVVELKDGKILREFKGSGRF